MNKTEHLLACLAEEAAEIGQAVGKALRFGLKDGYPGTDRTNEQDIANEVCDLAAIVEMLVDCGAIPPPWHGQRMAEKKAKVEKFMRYAEGLGTLTPNASNKGPAL